MSEIYIVEVNFARLRALWRRHEKREISEDEVRQSLVSLGFYPRIDGLFLAEEAVLRRIDPSAINAYMPVPAMRETAAEHQ